MILNYFSQPDKTAIYTDGQTISYSELNHKTLDYTNTLRFYQLDEGSVVAIQLSSPLEFYFYLLACLELGLTACPIQADSNKDYLDTLLNIAQPELLITDSEIINNKTSSQNNHFRNSAALITFTSGTTGEPKAVCHSLNNLVNCSKSFIKHHNLNSDINMLTVMPHHYMAGILNTFLCPLIAGGSVTIKDSFSAKNATDVFNSLINTKANCLWLSPSMLILATKLLRNKETINALEEKQPIIFIGTAPLPEAAKVAFLKKCKTYVLESYGTSEQLFISSQTIEECEGNNVGSLLPEVKVEFSNDKEILANVPWEAIGYLNTQFLSQSTGDLGVFNSDKLNIIGRKKDIIIKGGVNISPRFLEEAVMKQNKVIDCAVIKSKHDFWGEVPVVFMITEEGFCLDKLISNIEKTIPKEIAPEKFILTENFPRTITGKVIKGELEKLLA